MAKIALVFLLVATLAVASFARQPGFQRSLQQSSFTCGQAKALQGVGCSKMMDCLKKRPEFKTLGTPENLKLFNTVCARCAAATKTCPKDNMLPSDCKAGLSIAPIAACAAQLAKAVGH